MKKLKSISVIVLLFIMFFNNLNLNFADAATVIQNGTPITAQLPIGGKHLYKELLQKYGISEVIFEQFIGKRENDFGFLM